MDKKAIMAMSESMIWIIIAIAFLLGIAAIAFIVAGRTFG